MARRLADDSTLLAVVCEAKQPALMSSLLAPVDEAIRQHFAERDAVEQELLGDPPEAPVDHLRLERGGLNSESVASWVRRFDPDALVLYGTGILKPPLLDAYGGRIVNLHLGLSPYYRGAATNFWPLVERRPECVGATLHVAVHKVDAGPILLQVRPTIEAQDGPHHLGTHSLIAAAEQVGATVRALLTGRLRGTAQDLSRGRVFRNADFDSQAVQRMRRHFSTGMIREYLEEKDERDAGFPIVVPPGYGIDAPAR